MRSPRIKPKPEEGAAYYHLITRVVGSEMLLGEVEKEMMRRHAWLVAERCGIEVLTYHVMTNHVHIVVCAPKRDLLPAIREGQAEKVDVSRDQFGSERW